MIVVVVGLSLIYAASKASEAMRWFGRRNSGRRNFGKPETPPSALSQLIAAKREKICRPVNFVAAE